MVIALCVMTFWSSDTLRAGDIGVVGGASFTGITDVSKGFTTGYHAGITYKCHLPLGFAVQPSLLYHMKSSTVEMAFQTGARLDMGVGYLELPVSVQWGPDLLLFRPFLDVTPFIGYAVNNDFRGSVVGIGKDWKNEWDGLNRIEYGLGLGLGLEVWKIQVVGRYNWNFGNLFHSNGEVSALDEFMGKARSAALNDKNFGGVTISVAILF